MHATGLFDGIGHKPRPAKYLKMALIAALYRCLGLLTNLDKTKKNPGLFSQGSTNLEINDTSVKF
jgi:hypothetical protein